MTLNFLSNATGDKKCPTFSPQILSCSSCFCSFPKKFNFSDADTFCHVSADCWKLSSTAASSQPLWMATKRKTTTAKKISLTFTQRTHKTSTKGSVNKGRIGGEEVGERILCDVYGSFAWQA